MLVLSASTPLCWTRGPATIYLSGQHDSAYLLAPKGRTFLRSTLHNATLLSVKQNHMLSISDFLFYYLLFSLFIVVTTIDVPQHPPCLPLSSPQNFKRCTFTFLFYFIGRK